MGIKANHGWNKKTQYEVGFENGKRVGNRESARDGMIQGFRMFEVCFMYALKDRFKLPDVDALMLLDGVHEYLQMVDDGHISVEQMERGLQDTYKYKFKWKYDV